MSEILSLTPSKVWYYFDQITKVPRPSKKEEKILRYLKDFAKGVNLETRTDQVGNIVILKPATEGMEDRPTVVLQSHIDMVCEKNSDVIFNFDTDPIQTVVDNGWVRAEGTTLGADCGIGMAAALAILASDDIVHGPIEALFTVDEETGLTGAFGLGDNMIKGKKLINLDSEDEGEIFIGCAGGIDTIMTFMPEFVDSPKNYHYYRVDVRGLKGGHSGDDIDKGHANSNRIVARILHHLSERFELKLCYFDGGNLRNAIPR
ncbi:MAG: beta-Ala-His dipeptidase, partial [Rikenellaceae bacterium]